MNINVLPNAKWGVSNYVNGYLAKPKPCQAEVPIYITLFRPGGGGKNPS